MTPQTENTRVVADREGAAVPLLADGEHALNAKLMDTTGKRLLSRAEFCSMLGISLSTAERWDRISYGPRPVKVGPRRVGYRLADVLGFITDCTKPTAAA